MRFAKDDCSYTDEQVRRVARVAFEEARKRKSQMTNVHKSNVLATGRFWNAVVEDVAKQYPDVPYRSVLVDNAAFQLVIGPRQFNGVMLLENMQGDILTDQAGGVIGSLGLMPSACVGPKKSYVEPAHGSAPDIAGKNKANPYSMIGSIALMLELCLGLEAEARSIWDALFEVFEHGTTGDLPSPDKELLTTTQFGDRVVAALQKK
jgi:3-isopropylmalate dehydrogenase